MSQMIEEMLSRNGAYNDCEARTKYPHIFSQLQTCLSGSPFNQRSHMLALTFILQMLSLQDMRGPTLAMIVWTDAASLNRPANREGRPIHPYLDHANTMTLLTHQHMISLRPFTWMVARCRSVGPSSTSIPVIPISHLQTAELDSNHAGYRAMTVV